MTHPNWFAGYAEDYFAKRLGELAGKPGLRFLQIGAFTGDASLWLLENVLTGEGSYLVDVDTWRGSGEPEHEAIDFADVERVYDDRTVAMRPTRLVKYRGTSERFFRDSVRVEYDFAYIDGDHTAPGVLSDAVRAFDLLKVGGLLGFDDYLWKSGKGDPNDPALAIDAFLVCYTDRLELIDTGLQVWVRKLA